MLLSSLKSGHRFKQNADNLKNNMDVLNSNIMNQSNILKETIITSPINNLNYNIIWDGKNRCKKIITKRVV